VETFNPAAQRLFGRSFAAARNAPLASVLAGHPELARFILDAGLRSAAEIESGPFVFAVEVVPIAAERDGAPGDAAHAGGDRKEPADGSPRGRLALVRDVSEERRRERVRRQGESLMMLGEMAASLAHEVRNSLGVILGYSKAMSGETAKIIREVQFLTEMMEGFLRFARPVDKVARKPVALGPLAAAAGAAHELAVELPDASPQVQSDPLLLNVVLGNLALNARQAGAQRLRVRFAAGPPAAMVIADDGPGIPAANAQKVWLPFFSSRDKGTGMGLATVKKLLSALGADIQLLNPGEPGAQFKITFYS
jgi:signal transduction histidine kinase